MSRRRAIGIALAGLGALAALIGLALGPAGPRLVEGLADGRRIWRLGVLELEGVRGASLGDLRIARAALRDEAGVWAEARDVRVRWRPSALLGGEAVIDQIGVERLAILRRPELGPPPPQRSPPPDLRLAQLTVDRLEVAAAAAGAEAAFSLTGALALEDGAVARVAAEALPLDGGADRVSLSYRGSPLQLDARLQGPAGGLFAEIAGGPVEATASALAGQATARATVAGDEALDADLAWDAAAWRATLDLDLAAVAPLAPLAARFGATWRVAAEGGRGPGAAFTAEFAGRDAEIDLAGRRGEDLAPEGPITLKAVVPARWAELDGGRFALDGVLRLAERGASRFEGSVAAQNVRLPGFAASAAGAAKVEATRQAIRVDLDFADAAIAGPDPTERLLGGARGAGPTA